MASDGIYTLCAESLAELQELEELWGELVVERDERRLLLRVQAGALEVEHFLVFYELHRMLRCANDVLPSSNTVVVPG